jgi:hypothetical protein
MCAQKESYRDKIMQLTFSFLVRVNKDSRRNNGNQTKLYYKKHGDYIVPMQVWSEKAGTKVHHTKHNK